MSPNGSVQRQSLYGVVVSWRCWHTVIQVCTIISEIVGVRRSDEPENVWPGLNEPDRNFRLLESSAHSPRDCPIYLMQKLVQRNFQKQLQFLFTEKNNEIIEPLRTPTSQIATINEHQLIEIMIQGCNIDIQNKWRLIFGFAYNQSISCTMMERFEI